MKYVNRILKIGVLIDLLSLIAILGADRLVENTAFDKVYNSTNQIPHNKVGLFLGTGKILPNGRINLYYKYRTEATVKLFNAGKVDLFLVVQIIQQKNMMRHQQLKRT